MFNDKLPRELYDAYCEAVGGKAFNGDPLPKSEDFFNDPTKIKQADAWRKAAEIAQNKMLELNRNLGHPAYGISSSTTMAIDDLRNSTFEYLTAGKENPIS